MNSKSKRPDRQSIRHSSDGKWASPSATINYFGYNTDFSNSSVQFYFYFMFTINYRETGHDDHDALFLAIDQSGDVLGSAFAALEDSDTLRLNSIQTNPPRRGLGIGSALLVAVIGWGRERGATCLAGEFKPDPFAKPADVERFYAKRGISVTADGNLDGKL